MRILTYNTHAALGTDEVLDLERIAEVINAARPDLVALQEVDRLTDRSGHVDQAAVLAELTGLDCRFAKALDYDGGEYGNAALSRYPILRSQSHLLPPQSDAEARAAVEITVEAGSPAARIRFVATHLDHESEEERIAQVRILRELYLDDDPSPMVLAGDFNAVPGDGTLRELAAANWTDAAAGREKPTFPSPEPRVKIDYVFYRPGKRFQVAEVKVIGEKVASDHRPVLAVLDLPS